MDPSFLRGYQVGIQKPPVVFGLQLKPFTLGHLFLLEALECSLFKSDSNITLEDIGAAVFVCSYDHATARRRLTSKWFPIFCWFWSLFAKPSWLTYDINLFRDYLKEAMSSPAIRPANRDGARVSGSPGPWIKLFFAMHILGASKDEALLMEVVQINSLYATWAEWSGCGELGNHDLISSLWEYAREQDEKKRSANGAV